MPSSEPIKPLTRDDVADLLGVSEKAMDKLIREGSIPRPWQLGSCRRLYWNPEDWNASMSNSAAARNPKSHRRAADQCMRAEHSSSGTGTPRI